MRTKLPSFWNQKSSSFDLLWIPDVFPGKLPWCDYKMCNDNHVPRSPPLATLQVVRNTEMASGETAVGARAALEENGLVPWLQCLAVLMQLHEVPQLDR
jgi:hypothetical protein